MTLEKSLSIACVFCLFVSAAGIAQDVPLRNWTVPQYSLSGVGKTADATAPRVFIGLQPCRILDTRGNGAPIAGGIFANSEARNYTITGICGLPAGADAVSVNFTVTGSPAAPPGAFLLAWPAGYPAPPVSILNFQAGQTVANAAIVPLNYVGQITVNVSHRTHVIMDINGYFSEKPSGGNDPFVLESPSRSVSLSLGENGLFVEKSGAFGGTSIRGDMTGTGSVGAGVMGVHGGTSVGVWGIVLGSLFGASGVRGEAPAGGRGVMGTLTGPGAGGAGVYGHALAGGVGVYFSGGLAGTGTKSFIEPHPTDAALAIKYVSLEGREAGTYFRGRGKFERGLARIAVPEDFRFVTAEEGLSVQVTPIGEMTTVAVVRIDLHEIVVKGSRNVEFFYTVNGVRRAYRNWNPITSSEMAFRPDRPDDPLPDNLSEDERARLIANGTYTKDGRLNMETARKLGWDKGWSAEDRP